MTLDRESLTQCERCENAIQRFLDGEQDIVDSEIELHREICDLCRASFLGAHRLALGLRLLQKPKPSEELTNRLLTTVLSDTARPSSRRASGAWLVILAMAACLLLIVSLGLRFSTASKLNHDSAGRQPIATTAGSSAPVALERSFAEASSAVASLTRRTADETVEPAKILFSAAADSAVLTGKPVPAEPANESLMTMRKGATLGIEPVADSARRAVSLFMRDWAVDSQRKGGL